MPTQIGSDAWENYLASGTLEELSSIPNDPTSQKGPNDGCGRLIGENSGNEGVHRGGRSIQRQQPRPTRCVDISPIGDGTE
jgi:hypothetical protein